MSDVSVKRPRHRRDTCSYDKFRYTPSMTAVGELADYAAGQRGYFTRAQATELGVDDAGLRRALHSGRLEQAVRGVYRFAPAPPHRLERLFATWLQLEPRTWAWERLGAPDALVFGASALENWEVGDLPAPTATFAVSRARRTRLARTRLVVRRWGPDDWRVVDSLPTARVEFVVAELVHSHYDRGHLADALGDARRRHLVDERYLAERLGEHADDLLVAS